MQPSLVAQKILEIAPNGTWQLRHPVGPDAVPPLQLRHGMTDEERVNLYSSYDETYFARLQRDSYRVENFEN